MNLVVTKLWPKQKFGECEGGCLSVLWLLMCQAMMQLKICVKWYKIILSINNIRHFFNLICHVDAYEKRIQSQLKVDGLEVQECLALLFSHNITNQVAALPGCSAVIENRILQ